MLSIIGIGLGDEKDITVKGLERIQEAEKIYLESYTSKLGVSKETLEQYYCKKIQVLEREDLEDHIEEFLEEAKTRHIALLVIGDLFLATTHALLVIECKKKKIPYETIHNASIMNHLGDLGLSLYKFGKITSLPFLHEDLETPYHVLKENKDLHTLVLLDLDPKKNRYMYAQEAIEYFLKKETQEKVFTKETKCIIAAALGQKESIIKYGRAEELLKEKISLFPQCLIIPGPLHFLEEEALNLLAV